MKWVAVDYLTAMKIDDRNYYLQVGQAVKKLRDLAKEIDVFVILVSQLNRKHLDRKVMRPILADFRDSGIIDEFAVVFLFLLREGYYIPVFLNSDVCDWVT